MEWLAGLTASIAPGNCSSESGQCAHSIWTTPLDDTSEVVSARTMLPSCNRPSHLHTLQKRRLACIFFRHSHRPQVHCPTVPQQECSWDAGRVMHIDTIIDTSVSCTIACASRTHPLAPAWEFRDCVLVIMGVSICVFPCCGFSFHSFVPHVIMNSITRV